GVVTTAQTARGQNDFEEEFDEPPQMGTPPPPPPPPPPPSMNQGANNVDNGNINPPPPMLPGGSTFGAGNRAGRPGSAASPSASNSGGKGGTGKSLRGKNAHVDMAQAQPEDITDENFPNIIESFDFPNADIKD